MSGTKRSRKASHQCQLGTTCVVVGAVGVAWQELVGRDPGSNSTAPPISLEPQAYLLYRISFVLS